MKLNKIIFMSSKFMADVKNKYRYPIANDLNSQELGEFYFLFEEDPQKLNKLISGFDENGIPLNSAYIDVETDKLHYYPISIGQYALAIFNGYLKDKSEEKKNRFLRIADWFYENRICNDRLGCYWLTEIPKPEYLVYEPWKSAFTQSRAISVLLRAWQVSGNKKYLETAKRALIPFTFDISEGGVTANLETGKPFYEEYVASQPTMVLDGHIFSLLGLYDFVRAVPSSLDKENSELAKKLFNAGVVSLIDLLPEYDMGYWLRFNLCKMEHYPSIDPCTIGYLRLVLNQLELLGKITGNEKLIRYKNKFSKYDRLKNIVKMYAVKYKALKKLNRL